MKITAELAYNQLKVNRSRTMWTILAIALSTALITAVCTFVASGNAMIVDSLGEDYGEYGSSYASMLLFPAIVLGIIIVVMSITVISNVFRISASERVNQFGILKCTGATKKQIIETVMYESMQLCVVGIPLGMLLGLLLSFGGICITEYYIDELNALVNMMINKVVLNLDFVISWQALFIAAMVGFLTVLYSAWRPAKKAAKVAAIDCIRGAGEVKINRKQVKTGSLIEKMFGIEGLLAAKNMKRSRRNFKATVISLSVGVILFISLGGLEGQASAIQNMMTLDMDETVITDYTSKCYRDINPKTGKKDAIIAKPIDTACGNRITQELEKYGDIEIFAEGFDLESYDTVIPKTLITAEMQTVLEKEKEQDEEVEDLNVEILTLDQENYEKLCTRAGVSIGSNILLNYYAYNDAGNIRKLTPFSSSLKEVELKKGDGSATTVQIQGMLSEEQTPKEMYNFQPSPVRIVMQNAVVRGFSWYSAPEDIDDFMDYANQVMNKEFPIDEDTSYMEDGFSTRVYRINDYMRVMNMAIVVATIFMYSFTILLMLIGLTNVISTLSTNVMMRAREFAVLKSMGMTTEGLRKMLNLESIFCSAKALLYGVPIGILVTYIINGPIKDMLPIPYRLPWLSILLCVVIVFVITWGVTRYAANRLKHQNLIETIRSESGR